MNAFTAWVILEWSSKGGVDHFAHLIILEVANRRGSSGAGDSAGATSFTESRIHFGLVDSRRYFLQFLEEESCGKCLPCRLGLTRMREILDNFSQGKGSEQDIDDLLSLAQAVQDGALCALGSSAPNPVLTTIRYFRDEYIAHVRDQKCPAGVCKDLITYSIDPDLCTGCTSCTRLCPSDCISGEKKKPHTIDTSRCIRCGICRDTCKFGAVKVV